MIRTKRSRLIMINLLLATAISLVINMSYLFLVLRQQNETYNTNRNRMPPPEVIYEGRVDVHPDGYAYMYVDCGDSLAADTVYVTSRQLYRAGINDGDTVRAHVMPARRENAHKVMGHVLSINGVPFESPIFQRPNEWLLFLLDMVYYYVLSFILLMVATYSMLARRTAGFYAKRILYGLIVAVGFYLLAPMVEWRTGKLTVNIIAHNYFDPMIILKCTFSLVVAVLYGYIYQLLYQKQNMELENERLQNENLRTRYDMLVSQINPHFLFNSLNSLAMLVRDSRNDDALTYIDQLSYTFRYIIQNGRNAMTTLGEELKFLDAYKYMFETRYADKLFFDIEVDETHRKWTLPVLTLQPLIENAVKHNTITRANPLVITIRTSGDMLTVSNPIRPKIEKESGTGIGLRNLANRWQLLAGKSIDIIDDGAVFAVRMPLTAPQKKQ